MLVKGVVRGELGKAYRCVVMTAFSIGAVVACLPTLAPIDIARLLAYYIGLNGSS